MVVVSGWLQHIYGILSEHIICCRFCLAIPYWQNRKKYHYSINTTGVKKNGNWGFRLAPLPNKKPFCTQHCRQEYEELYINQN